MHKAYEIIAVAEKLPRQVECIACNNDYLYVGCKDGSLLVYHVKGPPYTAVIERSNKLLSNGKPITQIQVIPEYHILIILAAENPLTVVDLTVVSPIISIDRTRGGSLFALQMTKDATPNGESEFRLIMCVAVKKQLQLYYWKFREFHKLHNDLSLPDVPKAMAWIGDSICVGFKKEYFLIKAETGESKELFSTGKQMEPVITRLPDGRLALLRDESTIFIDKNGQPTQKMALTWSAMPQSMVYSAPYLIGVLPSCVEVRTIEPRLLIQSSEIQKPRVICCREDDPKNIYFATLHGLYRLLSTPITAQIRQLLSNKQFELALFLADMTEESVGEREQRKLQIRTLLGFDFFCQRRFEEALNVFSELGTDPSQVVGLFPNLLPEDFRNQLEYPDRLPELEPADLERGLLCLIDYLIKKRREVQSDKFKPPVAIVDGNIVMTSRRQISQIVDTTLLKCYVLTNDALVAPLLRLADNNCHVEESERVLKKHQKYSDLVVLYEKRAMHERALELLLKQSKRPNSVLYGLDSTVQYLQKLGPGHLDLIFEYANWVIQSNPSDGLQVFTEDLEEVKALPRQDVYNFLDRTDSSLAFPYIEHVVTEWNDTTMEFHHLYATQLMQKITEYQQSNNTVRSSESERVRLKLKNFLLSSRFYSADRLLACIPGDFYEERAIVLGRLGLHEKALSIYVHYLNNSEQALQYCHRTYEDQSPGYQDVYFSLLKMYLYPPSNSEQSPDFSSLDEDSTLSSSISGVHMQDALQLLSSYPTRFNPVKVLKILPDTVHLSDIEIFLESALAQTTATRYEGLVLKGLLYAKCLQVTEARMKCYSNSFVITEETTCSFCRKKISNSAFSRIPPNDIVHLCCKEAFLKIQAATTQLAWDSLPSDKPPSSRT